MPEAQLLLVDDDPVFLRLMQQALRKRGLQVYATDRGDAALRHAEKQRPAFAVLDLNMPEVSGLDLIAPLLACRADMRIVVLTGYASIATAVAAIKQGATYYLAKPAHADDLLHALYNTETPVTEPVPLSVEELEWEHIHQVLHRHQGNISATARALGMHRRTLQRKLKKYRPRRTELVDDG